MFSRLLRALATRLRHAPGTAAEQATRHVEAGIESLKAGDHAAAAVAFEQALALVPASVPALHGRATMHHMAGEDEEAIALCDEVLVQAPQHIDAWCTRAFASRSLGRLEDALAGFRRAVAIEARPSLISCVAGILFQQGRIAESVAEFDRAIVADPEADFIHSNRLFVLNHDPRIDRESLARAHFEWGRAVEARTAAARLPHDNSRDPARRLKVGYVSADLRLHSVAFFLYPVLQHHDHAAVEIYCYDNQSGRGDSFTERLRQHADHWVRIDQLDDAAFAARIRADRIDILVDLSGHTGGNRLPVFAMKPAPVQASWFGYMNTTGLATIDYRITDPVLCPPGSAAYYSETLFRLPSTAAWSPAPDSPAPGPPPALANRHVRFGSFNSWSKISDDAVALWARILARCAGSRLLVVAAGGDTPEVRAGIQARFRQHGIDAARLDIEGNRSLQEFLALVAGVDIALDPFPYNGGTTTFHTLWMGVPVVSMHSAEEVGRVGFGLLSGAGIGELCADSPQGYFEAAVDLAGDADRIARLRGELRARMAASTSMNGGDMTLNLEKAYRTMWHNHLKGSIGSFSL